MYVPTSSDEVSDVMPEGYDNDKIVSPSIEVNVRDRE